MKEKFELLYGFVHCRGKTTYSAGYVDTREEAEAWVRNHREGIAPRMKIPPDDPIRYCRASWCPFKKQQAWFDMARHEIEPF
ncbi:MAG: hypothetical protein CVU71_00510 [Deltaproteobacteria bacterium HGW-Deltaproteobacteria-6]|jgi:hypothetical protein|nr:MAG: hypothetical protein CVU71_00510 [Deltaproteobacteria bacterium HGW-Deltaproteobacteria-6]